MRPFGKRFLFNAVYGKRVRRKTCQGPAKDYTFDFNRVVRELETSHISTNAISRKYGIQGESTVYKMVKKYAQGMQTECGSPAASEEASAFRTGKKKLVLEHELSLLREKNRGYSKLL